MRILHYHVWWALSHELYVCDKKLIIHLSFFSLSSILYIVTSCCYLTCTISINAYCLFHKLCWYSSISTQVDIIEHVCVEVGSSFCRWAIRNTSARV